MVEKKTCKGGIKIFYYLHERKLYFKFARTLLGSDPSITLQSNLLLSVQNYDKLHSCAIAVAYNKILFYW